MTLAGRRDPLPPFRAGAGEGDLAPRSGPALPAHDDDALATAFARGETWAYEAVRARLRNRIRRDIYEVLHGMPAFVDEVEAETWLAPLIKAVDRDATFAQVHAWLRTIAVRKALDVRRKHGRHEPLDAWEEVGLGPANATDPVALKTDLVRALAGMRQQTLMVVVIEEIAAEDGSLIDAFARAAARLGKSTPYVKRLFYELRPLLAARLPGWDLSA